MPFADSTHLAPAPLFGSINLKVPRPWALDTYSTVVARVGVEQCRVLSMLATIIISAPIVQFLPLLDLIAQSRTVTNISHYL